MSNFGSLTEHFGTNADTDLILVGSTKTPVAQTRAEARDENNDVADAAWHGNTAGTLYEASNTYALKSGTKNINTFVLGEVEAGKVVETVEAGTSNDGWPQITLSGRLGTQTIVAPSAALSNKFTLPSILLTGRKQAQVMDFAVSGGRLTSSNFSASCELAEQQTGVGEPAAHGISGGIAEVTAELVDAGTTPAVTKGASWTLSQAVGLDEPQAAFHTSNFAQEIVLERTAV